jgi:hypothetical protein
MQGRKCAEANIVTEPVTELWSPVSSMQTLLWHNAATSAAVFDTGAQFFLNINMRLSYMQSLDM